MSEIQFGKRYRINDRFRDAMLERKYVEKMTAVEGFVGPSTVLVHQDGFFYSMSSEWFLERYELDDQPAPDPVNHPAHYQAGDIECIDAIKAALTPEEFRGYCKGTILAYVWRERHKGGDEDLRKAGWYLTKVTEASE